MAKLGDVFSLIRNGASIKQTETAGGFPITRIETISNREVDRNKFGYANIVDITKYESYILQDGDILMSHINSEKHLGKVALYKKQANEQIIHGMNLLILRANPKMLVPAYAAYFFETPAFLMQIQKITKKSVNQASFTITALKEMEIPIPSFDEQRRIASILNKVTDLINKRRAQLDKLDLLVKSRFVEMFGEPGTDAKGWGLVPLGKMCQINPQKGKDTRLISGMKVSFVPMMAVTETGEIDASDTKIYDEVKTGFTYFSEDDVLFAKITPCMENGKGAIAKGLYNGIGFGSTEFHVLRPIREKTNSHWIYTLTSFAGFRRDAATNMTGSAGQRRVPATFLENYKVSVPPIEFQNKFEVFVKQCMTANLTIIRSLKVLEMLKKALIQQYFKE